jgi:hypothetical protein
MPNEIAGFLVTSERLPGLESRKTEERMEECFKK